MDIWNKLQLSPEEHRMVSFVGAGGKTSTMYALAWQASQLGYTVIVTTTTHIKAHHRLPLVNPDSVSELRQHLEKYRVVTLGRYSENGKLVGTELLAQSLDAADVVLVEADGARMLPLKAPAAHEPVIPEQSNAVVTVAGLDAIGQPISHICHRPERISLLLGKPQTHRITPKDMATILLHPLGGRKGVPAWADFRCLLNKADTPRYVFYGNQVSSLLQRQGVLCAVTHYDIHTRDGACFA